MISATLTHGKQEKIIGRRNGLDVCWLFMMAWKVLTKRKKYSLIVRIQVPDKRQLFASQFLRELRYHHVEECRACRMRADLDPDVSRI